MKFTMISINKIFIIKYMAYYDTKGVMNMLREVVDNLNSMRTENNELNCDILMLQYDIYNLIEKYGKIEEK